MEVIAGRARVLVGAVALVAVAVCLPSPSRTPWLAVGLLALVHGIGERVVKGAFHPVLLAAVFLLPPPAAALVPLPGALCAATSGVRSVDALSQMTSSQSRKVCA